MRTRKANIAFVSIDGHERLVATDNETGECVIGIDFRNSKHENYLPGDMIEYSQKGENIALKNLSCLILRVSKFKRNLNGILKKLANTEAPLNRVLIIRKTTNFWCIPHDQNLQHPMFRSIRKPKDD